MRIIALLMPGAALLAFVLLFAAYMLVDGVLAIIAGVRAAQRHERWGWLVAENDSENATQCECPPVLCQKVAHRIVAGGPAGRHAHSVHRHSDFSIKPGLRRA